MCLSIVLPKEKINKLPKTMTVYKVAKALMGRYAPVYMFDNKCYDEGLNVAETKWTCDSKRKVKKWLIFYSREDVDYQSGFHFWIRKKDAIRYLQPFKGSKIREHKIIECQVKREDITTIGKEELYSNGLVIVAKKAIFPKYEE